MRKFFMYLMFLIVFIFSVAHINAQAPVWHHGIVENQINVRGNPVVVGELSVDIPEAGNVLVHFDGHCYASYGDLIVLAASNTTDWQVNDGNVCVEAANSDINRGNFSHTRMYPVTAGTKTFYAIAHNYVETEGTGIISLYASLTVKYFAASGNVLVWSKGIDSTRFDVRRNPVTLAEQIIQVPVPGNILVRFDGLGYADVGDRIVFAASDSTNWLPNDGCISIEAVNSDIDNMSFSHSRMYPVTAGQYSFYAVSHNWVEQEGNGETSVYGNLSVEFFPEGFSLAQVKHQGIVETDINVRDSVVTLAGLNITTACAGKVVAHFDGRCLADIGDRIVLAASNFRDWKVNDGNVGVEIVNDDQNRQTFSHTRVYEIEAGSHDFYAVAQNYVEQEGSGIASVYGNFTVEFFADPNAVGIQNTDELPQAFTLEQNYPNPFNPFTTIAFDLPENAHVQLDIYNTLGEKVSRLVNKDLQAGKYRYNWHAEGLASGIYFYVIQSRDFRAVKRMVFIK
jgi:hypothetical protein